MLERPSYEAYESKPKNERRQIVSASGVLERKRFLLSSSPEVKERLHKLQDLVYELKKEYPELICFSIYGSFTKGYAMPESDIDGHFMVDEVLKSKKHSELELELHERLKKELNLTDTQIIDTDVYLWSKERLRKLCHDPQWWNQQVPSLLFVMSVGRGIDEYRRVVFDELEGMGSQGEKVWKEIIQSLINQENAGFSDEFQKKRQNLYPKTLAEGRKYFLNEEPKLMDGNTKKAK